VKRLAILGSTGSVGRSALGVVDSLPRRFIIDALAAGGNWRLLAEQARKYEPSVIALAADSQAGQLREALAGLETEVVTGPGAVEELVARTSAETVVCAIPGAAALGGILAAARRGLTLALASKEAVVVAGRLVTATAARHGARIIPIDSEHSAIFQTLAGTPVREVRKVILTASGGPFRDTAPARLKEVTRKQALNHPTWQMGPKTTIDSGTLMNKALEIVEAQWLFSLEPEQIEVVIHPESIVHSMVEFVDGTLLAHMSVPDMRLPILYALSYPGRANTRLASLDLARVGKLTFFEADRERFTALRLGFEVARRKGTLGAVMNAANEEAVSLFLDGRLGFDRVCPLVEAVMSAHEVIDDPDLPQIVEADRWARKEVPRCI